MIAWAVEAMLIASMMMLLVLAVRKPVAEMFGAESAYALWLLPLFLPFLPPIPVLAPLAAAPITVILPAMPTEAIAAASLASASEPSVDWLFLLLAMWAGGAAFFAIWQQSTYSAFLLHLGPEGRRAVPPSYGGIPVVESDAVEGPVALGLLNRRIVVPLDFATRYSAVEQRLALEHELVHHRRYDLFWNWVALGMLTVNWFNPIAHLAFRAFRADQELACDAAVTRRSPALRHDYACALVKSASQPGLIAACPLNSADMLKRRLKMMKRHRASWARRTGGAMTIALLGAAGLTFGSPSVAQPEMAEAQVVVNTPGPEPLIAKAELAKLAEKCGSATTAGAIVCSGKAATDPAVTAIVANSVSKAEARVAARAKAAGPAVAPKAKVQLAALDAPSLVPNEAALASLAALAAPRHRIQTVHHLRVAMVRPPANASRAEQARVVAAALARARAEVRHGDADAIRAAQGATEAHARPKIKTAAAFSFDGEALSREIRAEVRASIRAARKEWRKAGAIDEAALEKMEAEMEAELERKLDRELDRISDDS